MACRRVHIKKLKVSACHELILFRFSDRASDLSARVSPRLRLSWRFVLFCRVLSLFGKHLYDIGSLFASHDSLSCSKGIHDAQDIPLLPRAMTQADAVLQGPKVTVACNGAFSDAETQKRLNRQLARCHDGEHRFGLWAVALKETGAMIGQCSLTMLPGKERQVLEPLPTPG